MVMIDIAVKLFKNTTAQIVIIYNQYPCRVRQSRNLFCHAAGMVGRGDHTVIVGRERIVAWSWHWYEPVLPSAIHFGIVNTAGAIEGGLGASIEQVWERILALTGYYSIPDRYESVHSYG